MGFATAYSQRTRARRCTDIHDTSCLCLIRSEQAPPRGTNCLLYSPNHLYDCSDDAQRQHTFVLACHLLTVTWPFLSNQAIIIPNILLQAYPSMLLARVVNLCWECHSLVCNIYPDATAADTGFLSMSIVFDSFVFAITLFCTFRTSQSSSPRNLLQRILRDGVVYFLFILSQNLLMLLCIKYARVGVYSVLRWPQLMFFQPALKILPMVWVVDIHCDCSSLINVCTLTSSSTMWMHLLVIFFAI